jgi:hypothetical protein
MTTALLCWRNSHALPIPWGHLKCKQAMRSEASADAQTIGVELILFIASSARRRTELNR